MVFNDFRAKVIFRVFLLSASIGGIAYFIFQNLQLGIVILLFGIIIFQVAELIRFITKTNRKLTHFFESIKYSDFISGFTLDNNLGSSFRDLNQAFEDVLEAFRKARSEKEEHWQYLNTVVQHVTTGLLSFDESGKIQLINEVAKNFLHASQIRNIEEFEQIDSKFLRLLKELDAGGQALYRFDDKTNLAVHATLLRLKDKSYKLVALQNIQSELQQNEIESWQNLTKVLRHEIMNSMTPIASLTSTLKDILTEELEQKNNHFEISEEGVDDIQEGLKTIEGRSKALINFIDAYRDYTTIPNPSPENLKVNELLDEVHSLMKIDSRKHNIEIKLTVEPEGLELYADYDLMQLVLINLLKNAIESVNSKENSKISIVAGVGKNDHIVVQIIDNGGGIEPEALHRIFIPFYTTKPKGSGIGLALCRQIMQLHNGSLTAESIPDERTVFTMRF